MRVILIRTLKHNCTAISQAGKDSAFGISGAGIFIIKVFVRNEEKTLFA